MDPINHPDDHKQHETPHHDKSDVNSEKVTHETDFVDVTHHLAGSENIHSKHSETPHDGIQRSRNESSVWDEGKLYNDTHSQDASGAVAADNDDVKHTSVHKQSDAVVYSVREESQNASEYNMQQGLEPYKLKQKESTQEELEQEELEELEERELKQQELEQEEQEEQEVEEEEDEEDDDIEERLQLYSEVLGLQKELDVVKEDEQRLRQQLRDTQMHIDEYDPQIAMTITLLEEEAQQSPLRKLWEEQCQKTDPYEMDWSLIDIANLKQRVQEVRTVSMMASEKVDMLYADRDAKVNKNTDKREQSKVELKERFEADMEGLQELRSRLKQLNDEHKFHQHRGTARVENRNFVSNEKKKFNHQSRVGEVEARTSAKVESLRNALKDLVEECKALKKQLDESQRISEEKKKALESTLEKTKDEGSEAREMRQMLEEEKEELSTLKADLQGVLHYVRAAKREEEIF